MARRWSISAWISESPGVASGALMSGIFLLVGLVGSFVFVPQLLTWQESAAWRSVEAEITGSGIAYSAHIGGFLIGLALIVPFSTGKEFEEHSWRYH